MDVDSSRCNQDCCITLARFSSCERVESLSLLFSSTIHSQYSASVQSYSPAGLSDQSQEQEPLTLSSLPVELLLSIFHHLAPSSLRSLSLSSRYLRSVAQPRLFHSPLTQSLDQLDQILNALSSSELNQEVRELTVVGRVFKSKGYGLKIMRILRRCERLKRLEIVGVDDLRPKHLVTSSQTRSSEPFSSFSHYLSHSLQRFT